jgi:hypothetical protein
MIAFKRIFENQFRGERLSINTLKKFSEDHLARITANPGPAGGAVEGLIAPTGAAHLNFFGNLTDVDTVYAVQQGITISVKAKMREFIALARKMEPNIEYHFGKGSKVYEEFYPHGLNEYGGAIMANIETLMMRFKNAADNNAHPSLPATLGADVQTMHDEFQALRSAQLGKKGDTDIQRAERNAARATLELQLWKNVLTIAAAHIDDLSACAAYFDEGILNTKDRVVKKRKKKAAAPAPTQQ